MCKMFFFFFVCAAFTNFDSTSHLFSRSGEDASLPLSSGGSYQILVNNVFYFTQRLVDKLWQGMFNKDSKLVVDFIVQLIGQVRTRAAGCVSVPSQQLQARHISLVLHNSLLRY